MLGDIDLFNNTEKMAAITYDAKELFGENEPYVIEQRMSGRVVIFNDHFIRTVREAFTTGCTAKMSASEEDIFFKFIDYQNGTSIRDISQNNNEIEYALDQWLYDDLRCVPHPVVNECFETPVHTWNTCT